MYNNHILHHTLGPHWWDMSPVEVKLFITLYWLADPESQELSIPLVMLSRQVNMVPNELTAPLEKLTQRGLINSRTEGKGDIDIWVRILSKKRQFSSESTVNVNDSVNDERLKRFLNKDVTDNKRRNVGSQGAIVDKPNSNDDVPASTTPALTARDIARTFDDFVNLALYENYLNRYPEDIIWQAYQTVMDTPRDKIKKSPGAYFTFLVKHLGEQ